MTTADEDIQSGDLPDNVNVLADILEPITIGGVELPPIDEGRAMMQLIHDVAPGANLLFHTAFSTEPTNSHLEFQRASAQVFADGIRALAAAGADIIVDDIGIFTEPFFQDGIIAQAVDEVVHKEYFISLLLATMPATATKAPSIPMGRQWRQPDWRSLLTASAARSRYSSSD